MPRLKLNRFRKIYKSLKTPWKPLNWLILGYLIGIENRYIEIVSKETVDTAIKNYLAEVEDPPSVFNAKIEETEDGGFTIGYYPEKKMTNVGLEIIFWTVLTLYILTRIGLFK